MLEANKIYCGDCLELMRQLPDKCVDAVITDLPYGLNYKMNGGTWGIKHAHSDMAKWDYIVDEKYIEKIMRVGKNQIIWGGNLYTLPPSRCWLIWEKPHLPTLSDFEMAWTSFDKVSKIFRYNRTEDIRVHPTQKPLKLFMDLLLDYTNPNDLILDPFLGSGTTAVACIKTGRRFIGMEISPEYCTIAQKRVDYELSQCKLDLG
jgi:site-specific DNA-methyltransferase (adenine-specific)